MSCCVVVLCRVVWLCRQTRRAGSRLAGSRYSYDKAVDDGAVVVGSGPSPAQANLARYFPCHNYPQKMQKMDAKGGSHGQLRDGIAWYGIACSAPTSCIDRLCSSPARVQRPTPNAHGAEGRVVPYAVQHSDPRQQYWPRYLPCAHLPPSPRKDRLWAGGWIWWMLGGSDGHRTQEADRRARTAVFRMRRGLDRGVSLGVGEPGVD